MKKTYVTSMPNHIGAFLKASKCFSALGINITRVSYNKAVDSHTLFIDAEGTEEQLKKVEETSKKTAILKSANMSLGINLLLKILQDAAGVLAPAGYDIEIVEKHHNQKVDAPSGTALALADAINEALNNEYNYKYDRSAERVKRDKKENSHENVGN